MFKKTLALTLFLILFIVSTVFGGALFNYPKFKAFDSNGDPLSGGKLYTYIAGTTTAKTTYSDVDLSTANANPLVLDSYGEGVVYGSGKYKFVLKDSDDSLVWTFDNLDSVWGYLGPNFYFADASLADQGVAVGSVTIKDFVDSIGATAKATIALTRGSTGNETDYIFLTSETISSNITILREPGARISVAVGKTVTINSPFESELDQAFTGSGTIAFGAGTVKEAYPEWWGENTTPGTTDMTAEIQSALDSGTKLVSLLSYGYYITDELDVPNLVSVVGKNYSSTSITQGTAGKKMLMLDGSLHGGADVFTQEIRKLYLDGDDKATVGIYLKGARHVRIADVKIKDCTSYGIQAVKNGATKTNVIRMERVYIDSISDTGIEFDDVTYSEFRDVWVDGCTNYSMYIDGPVGLNFTNCKFEEKGIELVHDAGIGAYDVTFTACDWIEMTGIGLVVPDNANSVSVVGGYIGASAASPPAYGITCDGDNCRFAPNGVSGGWTTASILLDSNSRGCVVEPNRMGDPGVINNGTYNIVYTRLTGANNQHKIYLLAQYNPFITLTNDATPSVKGVINCLSGGTTTITDFDDGVEGQVIHFVAEHSLTITDGTNIFLDGSANWAMTATDTLTLICKPDNKWYEKGRGDNGA